MITKSIGKNTLGGGKKMNVDLRTYNRSTHDLSYIWRSTMAPGTLVPFCKILAMPGDTFEFDLSHQVMTHPTVGPLFGSYKMQADIFQCPIRLYNALLHNNALNIGLDMKKVKLPKGVVKIGWNDCIVQNPGINQISTSCILAYLGQRGFAGDTDSGGNQNSLTIKKNAVPLIAYYDIFKNYYANKQEENFYTIAENKTVQGWVGVQQTGNAYISRPLGSGDNTYIFIKKKDWALNEWENYIITTATNGTYVNYKLKDVVQSTTFTPDTLVVDGVTYDVVKTKTIEDPDGNSATVISINNPVKKSLHKYPLEDIDETRESILSAGKNEWNTEKAPDYLKDIYNRTWGISYTDFNQTIPGFPFNGKQAYAGLNSSSTQSGLCVKTYQSDIFNNWINTDWIDGENGINSITAVKINPESNSFQLDTLNLAKKVYDMLNRIAVSGGTYQDWIETVYTNGYIERSETPIYEGGMSCEVEFNQVISNSATADEPLGSLAGRGVTNGQKGGHVIIKCDEPSYIIGIVSLTPRVDYCQGNDFDINLDTLDDIHKPALDAIGFQDRMSGTLDWKSIKYINGVQTEGSIGKQPAWIDYMTNFNKTYGNFAIKDNEAFMCLNRWFESSPITQSGDYTSYIDPQKYNYIFADTDLNAMNFWVQIGVSCKARRVMSAKVIPNL